MFLCARQLAVGISVLVLLLVVALQMQLRLGRPGTVEVKGYLEQRSRDNPHGKSITTSRPAEKSRQYEANLSILPGELPGYTGWPRPATTLASFFRVVNDQVLSDGLVAEGQNITFRLSCDHPEGKDGKSLFYVRAYGPSIVPGDVKDNRDGTYDISIRLFDSGIYQLEVVLTCSKRLEWSRFPVEMEMEPTYEGFLVPGFPRQIEVVSSQSNDEKPKGNQTLLFDVQRPLCKRQQLLQKDIDSSLHTGRWVLVRKRKNDQYLNTSQFASFTDEDIASARNGLGIHMDYAPTTGCRLLTESEVQHESLLKRALANSILPAKPLHIVFIGDSNTERQRNMFQTYFERTSLWQITWILTNSGLVSSMSKIRRDLLSLQALDHNFFVIYNAGLHDIDRLCNYKYAEERMPLVNALNTTEADFSCDDTYRNVLPFFVDAVQSLPSVIRVWQSTTAGWPKWGNFGLTWPTWRYQTLPNDPSIVKRFNRIAWEVMQEKNETVMDAFWLTLARPDHREPILKTRPKIGRRLVHAGPEVYSCLTRQWVMMILEAIMPNYESLL